MIQFILQNLISLIAILFSIISGGFTFYNFRHNRRLATAQRYNYAYELHVKLIEKCHEITNKLNEDCAKSRDEDVKINYAEFRKKFKEIATKSFIDNISPIKKAKPMDIEIIINLIYRDLTKLLYFENIIMFSLRNEKLKDKNKELKREYEELTEGKDLNKVIEEKKNKMKQKILTKRDINKPL